MMLLLVTFLFLCFIFKKISCGITTSPRCLLGKTAIVTGGNKGLGFEICLNLASRGCRVIIADKDNSDETRKKIIQLTKNSNIVSKNLNVASFKSIREFASDINKNGEKVDILINNAGIGGSSVELTEDNLNYVMQVNYFGPFLLTHLLIDCLKKSESARILFTSSVLAFCGNLKSDSVISTGLSSTLLTTLRYYGNSKLATIIASDIFAEKLAKHGITSNSLHPGLIATDIYNTVEQKTQITTLLMYFFLNVFGKSPWEGAQTAIHLAVSQEVENVTGEYFWDCRKFLKPSQTRDSELCKKVWQMSEDTVKLTCEERL